MYSLVYEPGIPGVEPIDLSGEDYTVGQATGLRSTQWSYSLASAGLSGVTASARETTLTVSARTPELFDRPSMIFDAEMSLGEPGSLVVDGQWRQRCYVTKTSTSVASTAVDAPSTQSWTVVLLDGVWTRLLPVEHFNPVTSTATGLDLPADLPLDLAAGGYIRYVLNDSLAPEDWRMTIFGPATDPHITIGGNIIELTGSIPEGSYATIDSRRRTITLKDNNGVTQNVFDWGVRSTGSGSGHYVFERIPAGQSVVSWPSSFAFDLQLVESRTDPTWGGVRVIPVDALHPAPITIGYGAGAEALARTTTVRWSDGHTTTELITWTGIPDTHAAGATLTATGVCAGHTVTQRILVSDDMFSGPAFTAMGGDRWYGLDGSTSRWTQSQDGSWTYRNPPDSYVTSETAGRFWGGNPETPGLLNPDAPCWLDPGDYTLVLPVFRADGVDWIAMNYSLSTDGGKTYDEAFDPGHTWYTPIDNGSMMLSFTVTRRACLVISAHFTAKRGTAVTFGRPELYQGVREGVSNPELTFPRLMFDSTDLPDGWTGANTYNEQTPSGILPALAVPYVRRITAGGWLTGPEFQATAGQRLAVTLVSSYWTQDPGRALDLWVEYADGSRQGILSTDPERLPAARWVTSENVITLSQSGAAHISIRSVGASTSRVAMLTVETLRGEASDLTSGFTTDFEHDGAAGWTLNGWQLTTNYVGWQQGGERHTGPILDGGTEAIGPLMHLKKGQKVTIVAHVLSWWNLRETNLRINLRDGRSDVQIASTALDTPERTWQTVTWHVTVGDDMDARPVLSSDKECYVASISFD